MLSHFLIDVAFAVAAWTTFHFLVSERLPGNQTKRWSKVLGCIWTLFFFVFVCLSLNFSRLLSSLSHLGREAVASLLEWFNERRRRLKFRLRLSKHFSACHSVVTVFAGDIHTFRNVIRHTESRSSLCEENHTFKTSVKIRLSAKTRLGVQLPISNQIFKISYFHKFY